MIHLLIDTCTYLEDPFRGKTSFRTLKRLCQAHLVTIHLPHLVKEEYVSNVIKTVKKQHKELEKPLAEAIERFTGALGSMSSTALRAAIGNAKALEANLSELKGSVESDIRTDIESWFTLAKSVHHDTTIEHVDSAFADYFRESPPFQGYDRSDHRRKNIPDAIIIKAAKEIAHQEGVLFVISKDDRFYETCAAISNITAYRTIDDFFKAGHVLTQLGVSEKFVNFHWSDIQLAIGDLRDDVLTKVNPLIEQQVVGEYIYTAVLPSSAEDIAIESLDELVSAEIEHVNSFYVGKGVIYLPVNYQFIATIVFCVPDDCMHELFDRWGEGIDDSYEAEHISSGEFEGHFEVRRQYEISFEAQITIELNETYASSIHFSREEFAQALEAADISLERVGRIEVSHI